MSYLSLAAVVAALLLFVWVGLRARRPESGLDDYITARNSQGAQALGLSFLASGMGGWILFAPPEVGALVGPVGLAGYALGAALPFIVLAFCGPAIRRALPQGRSIGEFAQSCFGGGVRRWVALISLLYMSCFLIAELTAIGAITSMLSDINPAQVIVGVALATLAYTVGGGLRASLVTDRWQAWLLLGLIFLVGYVALQRLPEMDVSAPVPGIPTDAAFGVALTLVIAVTAANLFHQGYWQRVWAAQDAGALGKGALLGGAVTVLVVAMVGGMAILTVMSGADIGSPPIPFFAMLNNAPAWLNLLALLLAMTLVASSVDTLQNAIASLAVTEKKGLSLTAARVFTVLLMVPVVLIALQGISVLRLFLIADLLCATAVVPVLMGLWSRMTPAAAIAGALAGLIGALLPGWFSTGSLLQGLLIASFPGGVPSLGPFLGALLASALVSLAVALLIPRNQQLHSTG
ncbi:MAG: sodium:solute symporter [Halopseudomonas sp.]|uniref:sodium:solute symporter family transporter n=1 Tax=Halopseudomonas sp. TaxID=2901191 RepID=UPI0030014F26